MIHLQSHNEEIQPINDGINEDVVRKVSLIMEN
jgi:hypothetical protein